MEAVQQSLHSSGRHNSALPGILGLYGAEAICSIAGTLLSIGTSFYMKERFHWGMRENFVLAAVQGLVYVPGALLAGGVARRVGRKAGICGAYIVLTLLSLVAWWLARAGGSASAAAAVAITLLVYTFVIGISWPILESMVAEGGALT